MYSEWSKKLISNVYNVEELKQQIKNETTKKEILIESNNVNNKNLQDSINKLKIKNIERDRLITQKITDIDLEIQNVNPRLLEEKKEEEDNLISILKKKLENYGENDTPEQISLEKLKNKKINLKNLILEITKEKVELRNIDKNWKHLEEAEICPLCKRSLEDVDHSEEIKTLKLTSHTLNEKIETTSSDITILEKEVETLEVKKTIFDEYEKELLKKERLVLEIGQKELEVDKVNTQLNKWKQNKDRVEQNKLIEQKILSTNSEIDILTNTKDTTLREIETNLGDIKAIDTLVVESKIKIDKIKKENEVNKIFRAYLTVFGKNGIIKTIVKSVVPKLNNELMRLLSDVTNFMVEIKVNDKNEVEFWMVDNESGVEKLLSAGSGFEKTLASLSIRTVLTKVSCLPRPNITVFDEVLGKVSNENLEQVGVFFRRIKDYFENVFLITHNPLVREWADNSITITKEKNISTFNSGNETNTKYL